MTRAALALLLFAFGAVSALAVEESAAPKDMVMLTVAGAIANTNRGPLDPKRDSLFALKGISFDRAFAFDRAMLLGFRAEPPRIAVNATQEGHWVWSTYFIKVGE